jgi:hypothetical protein
MPRALALSFLAASALLLTSGCAVNRATATVAPDTDLRKLTTFYVVQFPPDKRGIEILIRDNLTKRGFTATAGPELSPTSYSADAVVTYVDKWMWDMTMYMIELTITIRNPANNYPMATGNSYHTSLSRKSPPEMVDEVMTNIFNEGRAKQ